MRIMVNSLVAATLLLSSCATIHKTSNETSPSTPREAIWGAAQKAPEGLRGTFVMNVKAIGSQDGRLFINSEEDYRDQRCLTIVVPGPLVESFTARNGNLIGKTIRVDGEAKRVRINLYVDNRQTDKYYYQTHIELNDLGQLTAKP